MASTQKLFAVVVGAGPGTGRAAALRFAKAYPVVLLARTPGSYQDTVKEINDAGGKAVGISTDASDIKALESAFESIGKELPGHKLAAAIYNASARLAPKPFLEIKPEEFDASIDANIRGFFNFAQKALPLLEDAVSSSPHPPSLIVTGATASVKASARFAAFASTKWAKRALTQSLAREYGPKGVHVAHAVIDGVIDIPKTAGYSVNGGGEDSKISPDSIAETYWNLHTQHRSGFTWEVDIRPFIEKW
ncbi:Uu.00g129410.m01.CDS01 [Anthostomella pinea]|uniref:Uu.00g129410.m01.CDS01 n=1 Tax=Anthostomella pinea TaxID=933095 RepID=A0AAI8VIK1_9PEZI|nr:Uu.00g129410.m01.CDS01 [Anthostomella pinea]